MARPKRVRMTPVGMRGIATRGYTHHHNRRFGAHQHSVNGGLAELSIHGKYGATPPHSVAHFSSMVRNYEKHLATLSTEDLAALWAEYKTTTGDVAKALCKVYAARLKEPSTDTRKSVV